MASIIDLETIQLKRGSHSSPESGTCAMEAVSLLAGEPFSDHPACTSHVISTFVRIWNDALPDLDRDRLLRPVLIDLIGTASDAQTETDRSYLALDWLVRSYTPVWLDLAHLSRHAAALRELPRLTGPTSSIPAALRALEAAREAAGEAARAATRTAAWAAAYAAAGVASGDAAGTAAWAAAWAAGYAAGEAAEAAGEAAEAAGEAAWKVLAPTTSMLQQSALSLLSQMIAI